MNWIKKWAKLCLLTSAFAFFMLFVFENCNKKESVACSSIKSIDNIKIDVKGTITEMSANTWTEKTDPDFGIMSTRIDNESLIRIKNALLNTTTITPSDFLDGLVLYLSNSNVNDFKSITLENITGFSVYESKLNTLSHRLFLSDQTGKFTIVNELSSSTSSFLFNDMNDIMDIVIPKSKGFKAYILIANKNRNRHQKLKSADQLTRILNTYKRNTSLQLRTGGAGDKRKCPKPCSGRYGSRCDGDPDLPECHGDCGDIIAHDDGNASESVRNTNLYLHYQFRDQFLLNSTFGQSYLGYHEALSLRCCTVKYIKQC